MLLPENLFIYGKRSHFQLIQSRVFTSKPRLYSGSSRLYSFQCYSIPPAMVDHQWAPPLWPLAISRQGSSTSRRVPGSSTPPPQRIPGMRTALWWAYSTRYTQVAGNSNLAKNPLEKPVLCSLCSVYCIYCTQRWFKPCKTPTSNTGTVVFCIQKWREVHVLHT